MVTGAKKPHETATFELVDADGDTRGTAVDSRTGNTFEATLLDAEGHAVDPAARDLLLATVAGGIRLRILPSSLVADRSDHTVRGRCMPESDYFVTVHLRDQFPNFIRGRTGASGRFESPLKSCRWVAESTCSARDRGLDRLVMTTEVRP